MGKDYTLVGVIDSQEVRFPLSEGTHLVGRADEASLRLVQPGVSRRHAEISVGKEEITVRDLGSHNGTRINGAKVLDDTPLGPGDRLDLADLTFRLEGPGPVFPAQPKASPGLVSDMEMSWEEVRTAGDKKRDMQSLLFRVLAKAGDLLTIPRAPQEMFEPILDLVETALLKPERIFVLLLEEGQDDLVRAASRNLGNQESDDLILSTTLTQQVLREKKSFLTTDPLNDPGYGGMMSMVSQGIRSAIAVPLFDNEEVIGILYADDTRPGRVFIKDQLAAFTLLANTIAVALTHARYHEMEKEKRRQDAQLATAGEILDSILPATLAKLEGYEILASMEPCFEVGGDLYDARPMPDGRYAFLIGDVVGKGLGAALLVCHILSLTRFMVTEGWEPAALITQLDKQVLSSTDHVRFATFFLGCLEPETGRVTYVNAGHNPPFLVRSDGTVTECASTGPPVGIIDGSTYKTGEFTLEAGDLLALYSDGIPETQDLDDEEYGEDSLKSLLLREKTSDLESIFQTLQGELREFRGQAEIGDDITLVTLRRR